MDEHYNVSQQKKQNAVIVSCFHLFDCRIKPVYERLSKQFNVTVLTTDYSHTEKKKEYCDTIPCTYISVPPYNKNVSIKRIYSHLYFARNIKRYLDSLQPQMIYVFMPPNILGKICEIYKREHPRVKMIVDIIDLWPESMVSPRIKRLIPVNTWQGLRNDAIRRADYVVLECQLYMKMLSSIVKPDRTRVLYLYKQLPQNHAKLLEQYGTRREDGIKHNKQISFCYLGSINNIIDIDGICAVISNATDQGYQVLLHIIGRGTSQNELINKAKASGCEVIYHGVIYDEEEKIQILASCDYALNMMKETVAVGMTIKSMDYLSMGLPMINNIKGDTWELVKNEQIGINIIQPITQPINFSSNYDRTKIISIFDRLFSLQAFSNSINQIIENVVSQQ